MSERVDIPLLDDNPTTTDRLGFSALVEITVEALVRPNLDPVCVGITGPWGSGKTSIARQVEADLVARDDVLVVYVEPWAFDPNTDPKAHLIGDVLNAISKHVQKSGKTSDLMTKVRGLLQRVRWSRAVGLAASTALTAQIPDLDKLASLFGPADSDTVSEPSIDSFRGEFTDLMTDENMNLRRVVVIVDDLDRCLSDTVIAVLEAIKLFLAVPRMAFLVAADETAVRTAIASRYANAPTATELAERYLDKIVQIPVRVPVLDRIAVEAYVLQLLVLGLPSKPDLDLDRALRAHCDALRHEPISTFADHPPSGVATDHVELAQRLAPLLHVGLDGNPRRVKRFLNAMGQSERLARARGIDLDRPAAAKLMVLEQVHPIEFNRLLSWVRSDELEPRLEAAASEEDGAGTLADWIRMPPRLDAATVRRYMMLAASLRGEVVAVHALPEHLRDMASALFSANESERDGARRRIEQLATEDAIHLGHYLAQAIRTQPELQADHAESLGRLALTGEPVADAIAGDLIKLRAERVDPALVIALLPPRSSVFPSVRVVVEGWRDSGQLASTAERAAKKALADQGG